METKTFEKFEQEVQEMPWPNDLKSIEERNLELVQKNLKNGKSPFLPNEQGFIDIKGAYNMNNNNMHHGYSQLILREQQAKLNAPTGAFVTWEMIKKAQNAGVDCAVKKGQHSVQIKLKSPTTSEYVTHYYFNISQIENPENLKSFLDEKMAAQVEKTNAYNKENKENFYEMKNPAERDLNKPNEKVMKIRPFNTPAEYLGQVFTAISQGIKLIVSSEEAAKFKEDFLTDLNVNKLFNVTSKANDICKKLVSAIKEAESKEQQKDKVQVKKMKSKEKDFSLGM